MDRHMRISRHVQVHNHMWDAHGLTAWMPDIPGWQQAQWHMAIYRWPDNPERATWYFAVGWGPDSASIWCHAHGSGGSPFGGVPFYQRKGNGAWTEDESRVGEGVRILLENLEAYRAAHAAEGWPGEPWSPRGIEHGNSYTDQELRDIKAADHQRANAEFSDFISRLVRAG